MLFEIYGEETDFIRMDVTRPDLKVVQHLLIIFKKGDTWVESLMLAPTITKQRARELKKSSQIAVMDFGYRVEACDQIAARFVAVAAGGGLGFLGS